MHISHLKHCLIPDIIRVLHPLSHTHGQVFHTRKPVRKHLIWLELIPLLPGILSRYY